MRLLLECDDISERLDGKIADFLPIKEVSKSPRIMRTEDKIDSTSIFDRRSCYESSKDLEAKDRRGY